MNMTPQEQMMERIFDKQYLDSKMESFQLHLNLEKLAQVLVEMDTNMNTMYRLLTAVREVEPKDWKDEDPYLTALDDVEKWSKQTDVFEPPHTIAGLLELLRKKHKE